MSLAPSLVFRTGRVAEEVLAAFDEDYAKRRARIALLEDRLRQTRALLEELDNWADDAGDAREREIREAAAQEQLGELKAELGACYVGGGVYEVVFQGSGLVLDGIEADFARGEECPGEATLTPLLLELLPDSTLVFHAISLALSWQAAPPSVASALSAPSGQAAAVVSALPSAVPRGRVLAVGGETRALAIAHVAFIDALVRLSRARDARTPQRLEARGCDSTVTLTLDWGTRAVPVVAAAAAGAFAATTTTAAAAATTTTTTTETTTATTATSATAATATATATTTAAAAAAAKATTMRLVVRSEDADALEAQLAAHLQRFKARCVRARRGLVRVLEQTQMSVDVGGCPHHAALLHRLWRALYPREHMAVDAPSARWQRVGFSGPDTTRDLVASGLGLGGLQWLVFCAEAQPELCLVLGASFAPAALAVLRRTLELAVDGERARGAGDKLPELGVAAGPCPRLTYSLVSLLANLDLDDGIEALALALLALVRARWQPHVPLGTHVQEMLYLFASFIDGAHPTSMHEVRVWLASYGAC